MNIVDFESDADQRLKKILSILENRFGISLDTSNVVNLRETFDYCEDFKLRFKMQNHLNQSDISPDYTKASLLSEAIKIILREIAPKRQMRIRRVK